MIRTLLLLAIAACITPPDDCERAIARLERLNNASTLGFGQARSRIDDEPSTRQRMLESCRSPKGQWDPVLRCAMDSPTDEATAACIERHGVIKPGPRTGGSGINPLLQD
jgi:hypothetical protein